GAKSRKTGNCSARAPPRQHDPRASHPSEERGLGAVAPRLRLRGRREALGRERYAVAGQAMPANGHREAARDEFRPDALAPHAVVEPGIDRKSTRLNSSHVKISYA